MWFLKSNRCIEYYVLKVLYDFWFQNALLPQKLKQGARLLIPAYKTTETGLCTNDEHSRGLLL